MQTIYCVEDDEDIRSLLTYAVSAGGYEVMAFENGASFKKAMGEKLPDLILLDIMLPDKSGTDILKALKSIDACADIPVIMLTAKGAEMDKVRSFELGADDYVTKPFSVLELMSRIKAVLKRSRTHKTGVLEYNGIRLDLDKRTVSSDGEDLNLTFKEFELLAAFMENKGNAIERGELLNKVWGYNFEGESRTLDVHVGSLRHKLGEKGKLIETIRNVGYRLK